MKYLDRLIFTFLFLSILGFSFYTTEAESTEEGKVLLENSNSTSKIIKTIPIYSFTPIPDMKASWYGSDFHGRKTASGEVFDKEEYTAAHKTLKFGTLLRVTNKLNDRSILVKINDRGPYIHGRDLDLSEEAAKALAVEKRGVFRLGVEIVSKIDSIQIME